MNVRPILRAGCIIGLLAAAPAFAQTVVPPNQRPAPVVAQSTVRPNAATPALHRQPRAADVPPAVDDSAASPLNETADDAQMNRMMRNICRGC